MSKKKLFFVSILLCIQSLHFFCSLPFHQGGIYILFFYLECTLSLTFHQGGIYILFFYLECTLSLHFHQGGIYEYILFFYLECTLALTFHQGGIYILFFYLECTLSLIFYQGGIYIHKLNRQRGSFTNYSEARVSIDNFFCNIVFKSVFFFRYTSENYQVMNYGIGKKNINIKSSYEF